MALNLYKPFHVNAMLHSSLACASD